MTSNKNLNIFIVALFLTLIEFSRGGMDFFTGFGYLLGGYLWIYLFVWIGTKIYRAIKKPNTKIIQSHGVEQ